MNDLVFLKKPLLLYRIDRAGWNAVNEHRKLSCHGRSDNHVWMTRNLANKKGPYLQNSPVFDFKNSTNLVLSPIWRIFAQTKTPPYLEYGGVFVSKILFTESC